MFREKRLRFICLSAVLCLATGTTTAVAQQSVTAAILSGRIEDPSGAALPDAAVSLTNLSTNQSWNTTSNTEGRFRLPYLPPGQYRLIVRYQQFNELDRQLTLLVGEALELPLRLSLAGSIEHVSVTVDLPMIELVRTQVAETVLPQEIDSLPLNGRNYLDLALLIPSVSRTNTGSNQRFAETSAVPGTGISISGQRNLNNSFIVDGLSANDDAADLAGTFYSQEVIREFQAVTSGGVAEFGRASSGTVNIVTRSGGKDWHGRAYGFLRNQRLDARNPLSAERDPLTQAQYGATISGPVYKDRTFFFANFEQTRQNAAGVITIRPADVAAINARLDGISYSGRRIQTGQFPTKLEPANFFIRADHRLTRSNQLTARYSLYDISSSNARTVGGLNDVSRGSGLLNRDQTVALSDLTTINPTTFNEARFQFTRSRLAAPVNDLLGPAVNISGVASFGTATFSPTARALDLYEWVDNLSQLRGAHSWKGGADVLYNRVNIAFPGALQGVYTFASLPSFLAGNYINFQQAFGAPSQFQSNANLGLFVQDEWRVRPNLTINAGLRYDVQFLSDLVHTDTSNVAPRIGLAYAPGARHKTVIRASYGIYYERIPLRAMSNALERDGVKYQTAVLNFGQPGAPVFPAVLPGFPSGLLTGITSINPNVDQGYSQQASLQIERELSPSTSVSVGYLHLRGLHLIMTLNVNVPTCITGFNLCRPDPRFGNNSEFNSAGDSYYDGMTVSLNKRAARWGRFRFSYNLSKAVDTAGNFFFSTPQDPRNVRDDRGLSDNDQRHRITASGTLNSPWTRSNSTLKRIVNGFQLGYIVSYTSALPFNIQAGTDRLRITQTNARPPEVGRNTGRGFDFASVDLRLSRTIRFGEHIGLEAMAEAFNVLNRRNNQLPNNTITSPSFGQPTAVADPRQIQFGLRLSF